MKPNYDALSKLSNAIKCNGYYVFTVDFQNNDILVHGRMFAFIELPKFKRFGEKYKFIDIIKNYTMVNFDVYKKLFRQLLTLNYLVVLRNLF